jgi:hypothetical protein
MLLSLSTTGAIGKVAGRLGGKIVEIPARYSGKI